MRAIDIPPAWLILFLGLNWLIAGETGGGFAPLLKVLGWVLIAAGFAITLLAVREFRRHRTSVILHTDPSAIITTGIYEYTRNPIYLSDVLILLGVVLAWGAPAALILVPVFAFVLDRRFIRAEEARLASRFPAAFEAYAAQVRRWI